MIDLFLLSGLHIHISEENFLRFAQNSFSTYDGEPITENNCIRGVDIAISTMMNSRISGNTALEILKRRERINNVLAIISTNSDLATLTLETINRIEEPLKKLINIFCGVERVGLSTATKILHRKRPKLIPMFDRVVENYYRKKYPRRISSIPPKTNTGKAFIRLLKYFHDDLVDVGVGETFQRVDTLLQEQNTPLTKVRILEALIWVTKEPSGKYRNT